MNDQLTPRLLEKIKELKVRLDHLDRIENRDGFSSQIGDLDSRLDTLEGYPHFVPLTTPLTSTSFDGDSFSTTSKTLIDLSSVFSAPAGVKAVYIDVNVRDSGSDGITTYVGIVLGPTNVADAGQIISCNGMTNDAYARQNVIVPCDANGDIYYQTVATGTNTLDVFMKIYGYWI